MPKKVSSEEVLAVSVVRRCGLCPDHPGWVPDVSYRRRDPGSGALRKCGACRGSGRVASSITLTELRRLLLLAP